MKFMIHFVSTIYVIKKNVITIYGITSKDFFYYIDPYYMAEYCNIKIIGNILK